MGDFKKLKAWQESGELVKELHQTFTKQRCDAYPGLRAQVLRAAGTIPATLAEGCAKRSRMELARFAEMAYASAKEIEAHLITARDTNVIPRQRHADLARRTDHVAALCFGLTRVPPPDPVDGA